MSLTVSSPARGITTVTLDMPERRNALSAELVGALAEALGDLGADSATRAVLLTHTGPAFCSGADLKAPPDPAAFVALLRQIVALPKPVVARVDGHVRAGGLGLLGACDLAAAGPASSFAFTEVHIGVAPAVISLPLLPRLDPGAASRYYLTGERFDAAEAARIGLVTVAGEDADAALVPLLDGLRAAAPGALAETKKLLTARVLDAFDDQSDALTALSARLFGSTEARDGMTAFLERRERPWVL
ncbi:MULTISPECIES: enoyl-CoA hydratase family protein [Streptomyces]|uniref:Enoyl-CoA hydratase family protein n=3 Tax=Streptomyces TaxID=1883 RepID=A0A5P2BDQ5_STRVZ|nr:enoyl-CoA hydratase family protein [Streptomyces venezuelae]MYY84933.1 enoyl-CoA hydratase family protein [Streptomyces sp. SID335]MYZ16778.1 enoyl-CoA hydratase family protein [Streptomyces sp. SID337]NEB49343.1 enoyl-CoA hydratase family protein [Streptomyces sp. SID339]QES27868.1 enoyl-CoA hydratase family protein [Streptomyces venezuelae]